MQRCVVVDVPSLYSVLCNCVLYVYMYQANYLYYSGVWGVVLGGLGCSTTIKLSCKGLAPSEAGNLIYESTNMDMAALIHCTALHTMQL